MSNVLPFQFQAAEVRVIQDENGEPWFVAKDVAEALGYARPDQAVNDHCKGVETSPLNRGVRSAT